jgi:flagellin-like protein
MVRSKMNNPIQMLIKNESLGSKNFPRRGVAPVIATLLLVAIAVVGGSIIFVFAQGFFSDSQVSGAPKIELVKIIGYDARDVVKVKAHDGIEIEGEKGKDCCGITDGKINADERIAIYLQNNSVEKIYFSEIRIAGVVYDFTTYTTKPPPFSIGRWDQANVKPQQGEYVLLAGHNATKGKNSDLIQNPSPKMEPGQLITILVDLDQPYKVPRDVQFKLTTTNGAVFVSTIIMGGSSD